VEKILEFSVNIFERIKAQSNCRVSAAAVASLQKAFGGGLSTENQVKQLNDQLTDNSEFAAGLVQSMIEVHPILNKTSFQAYFSDKLFVTFGIGQKTYNLYDEKYANVMSLLQSMSSNTWILITY
jgi:hypothetical protein